MIIALITEFFAREGDPLYGGVDSRAVNLFRELAKRNEIHVFASNQNESNGEERYGDIIVHRVGKSRPFAQGGSFLSRLDFNKRCAKEISRLDPDVIEASGLVSYLGGAYSREKAMRPTMVTVHEVWQGQWLRNVGLVNGVIGNMLERSYLRKQFDRYIAVSQFTKERLTSSFHIDPDRVTVIKNGVDKALFDSVKVDSKFNTPTIVTICRLVSYKKVDRLIQATALLKKKYPDLKLLIVGKGPEEFRLRQLANELGLSHNVEFLGKFNDVRDMIRVMKKSHVFALSSIVEGFGIVVVEAIAAEIPYVVSDIPPLREASKGGIGGQLFNPLDVNDLVSKLTRTLEEPERAGDSRTETLLGEYDWRNIAQIYENEAKELVEGTKMDCGTSVPGNPKSLFNQSIPCSLPIKP